MNEHAISPIVRHSLHDELVGRIRDMIIEGQLTPGSRIHEGQLGQALGVSRTPLREALKFLASEGLDRPYPRTRRHRAPAYASGRPQYARGADRARDLRRTPRL